MSQITKLITAAPPGAGILTIEGDVGLPAGPDGGGNFLIVGAGGITTTSNAGTSTLTITNNAIATQYDADIGHANPAAGILNIFGTLNEIDTNGAGNTIRIGMPADVTISHNLTVTNQLTVNGISNLNSDLIVTGNIGATGAIASNLSIIAPLVVAENQLTVNLGGVITLNNLNQGIMQVDAAHHVFTDNGNDGQIIIGNSSGDGIARWRTITAGAGIHILNGPNSITISNDDANLDFRAKNGAIANPAAGVIIFTGDANVNSIAAGNSVTYSLANNVTIPGTLTATTAVSTGGNVTAGGNVAAVNMTATTNITATNGNISATNGALNAGTNITGHGTITTTGNISTSAGNITATAGSLISNQQLVVQNNGASINGNLVLLAYGKGILQLTTPGTTVGSTPAVANGQLLIGNPAAATSWTASTLTAGAGINIANGAGSITITNTAGSLCVFRAEYLLGDPYTAVTGAPVYVYGATKAMTVIFDTDVTFYPGDGAGAEAFFQAPYTGYFQFTVLSCLGFAAAASGLPGFQNQNIQTIFTNLSTADSWTVVQQGVIASSAANSPYRIPYLQSTSTQLLYLTAGQQVSFSQDCIHTAAPSLGRFVQWGPDWNLQGQCYIAGYCVRRI